MTPPSIIAHYRITSKLGEGGMGAVYRATDTKLNRDVAIKVLPDSVSQDPDRLARFEREAKVLASLNHPNIAQIYGVEDRALVMELVAGETLRGPLPLETALAYAKQIADALEAAHEKGVIHRDLKPANIMVTPEGMVKVLDFGLAAVSLDSPDAADPRNSPTLTMNATRAGMIMGTAGYMSPEQARGALVDRRADIWAFGVVLYEMLTGKRLFDGATVSDLLASILKETPDLNQAPEQARRLLASCLERDPRKRLRDIGDWQHLLTAAPPLAIIQQSQRGRPWMVAAALSLLVAGAMGFALANRPPAASKVSVRLTIPLPQGQEITTAPAITRDGATVAYVTQRGSQDPELYLRDLNSFEAREVPGSSGARQPFFSPDGKWVAFFARGQLQKAEVTGGAPIGLAEGAAPFGGTWNDDNTIIYAPSLSSGLLRIGASGGTPQSLTKPDGAANGYAHVFPQTLPGGRQVYFTVWGQNRGGALVTLDTGRWEMVMPQATMAVGVFDTTGGKAGRILLVGESAGIKAAPFDAAHPARTIAETTVLWDVYHNVESEDRGWLAVSHNRTAVYVSGNPAKRSLVWVDRDGKAEPVGKDEDLYTEVSLSPDGSRIAARHNLEIWIHDLRRGTRSRLTPPGTINFSPLWSPDGTRIVFASNRGGDWDLYTQAADGSRPAEVLLARPHSQLPFSILGDGTVLFSELHPKTGADLWTLSPDGKVAPLRVTPFNEQLGQFSPGPAGVRRRVAYTSDESGRNEVYLEGYPGGADRITVSTGGGTMPKWSRDGKELFYVTPDAMVAVPILPDGSVGSPRRLFDRSNLLFYDPFQSYDVSADGKRFLMIQRDPGSMPRQLNVILNWTDDLRPATEEKK